MALKGLLDGWRMNFLDSGTFAVAKLRDSRTSHIEVLKFTKQVCDFVLGDWLQAMDVAGTWKSKLRDAFKDHVSCAVKICALSWM